MTDTNTKDPNEIISIRLTRLEAIIVAQTLHLLAERQIKIAEASNMGTKEFLMASVTALNLIEVRDKFAAQLKLEKAV